MLNPFSNQQAVEKGSGWHFNSEDYVTSLFLSVDV